MLYQFNIQSVLQLISNLEQGLSKTIKNNNHRKNIYRLKVQVNDLKPIDRFMRGMDLDKNFT